MRYRYRILEAETRTIIIRDDGYRIHYKVLESTSLNEGTEDWDLWADYKQCDFPGIGQQIADALMKDGVE